MYHHMETTNQLTTCDKRRKMALDTQTVRAKQTPRLATVGQASDKYQTPTHRLKL